MSFAAAAGLMTACETDLETVQILPMDQVVAPVFHDLGVDEIAFTASNQTETLAFAWDAAYFGEGAIVTYSIEAAIPEISKQVVQGIATTEAELTYEDLNKVLALSIEDGGMGIAPDAPADVELRIGAWVGNVAVYSEAQTVRFSVTTAEKSYDTFYVVGDFNGWTHSTVASNFDFLYNFKGDANLYEGVVDFKEVGKATNGFKFTKGDWGVSEHSMAPEQTELVEPDAVTLVAGGGDNITVYGAKRYYHFALDVAGLTLTKNYSFDQIGIVGDFNSWGEDVVMTFNAAKRRFYADVENLSGGFKFRADADWALNWGGVDGVAAAGGDNIAVEEAGNYRVYLYISDSNDLRYELNAKMYGTEGDGVVETPEDPKPEVESGGKIIYVNNEDAWEATYLYTWNAVDGGESTGLTNAWPGKEMTLTATQNGKNYVGYEMPASTNGFSIKFIFNNNAGTQTGDSEAITLDRNYYFTLKNGVATEDTVEEVSYKLYFDVSATDWTNVNAWIWDADGVNYTGGTWPGQALVSEEKDGKTYWVFEAPVTATGKTLSAIVNNGTEQTVDIAGVEMTADHVITLTEKNADGKWLATLDGTEAPEPEIPVVVLADHTWGVIGVNGAWGDADDKPMTAQDGWVVATGVTFNADNSEFKVRADGKWEISYGVGEAPLTVDGEAFDVVYNAGNLVMPTAGTYDIYFTIVDNVASMKIVAAEGGTTPEPEPEPTPTPTGSYKIYAYSEDGWSNMNLYAWDAANTLINGAWAGTAMSTEVVNGLTYFVAQLDATYNGQTINLIFNNGSAQTGDIKDVVLDKDLYYAVSGASATVIDPAIYTPPTPSTPDPSANKIYLKPGQWASDSARIEAYFYGNGDTWATMTASSTSGVLECEVPAGYTNVIFVRMDPAKAEHNWDSKWNQTGDLTLPTGDKNCYVITDDAAWNQGSLNDSLWQTL